MDHRKMGNLHWLKSKCQFPACIKNEGMCTCKKNILVKLNEMMKFTLSFTWNVLTAALIKHGMRKNVDVPFLALYELSLNEQLYLEKLLLFRNVAL